METLVWENCAWNADRQWYSGAGKVPTAYIGHPLVPGHEEACLLLLAALQRVSAKYSTATIEGIGELYVDEVEARYWFPPKEQEN